jgi:hypothetical protein
MSSSDCDIQYLVLFRGDDSNFELNQRLYVEVETDVDISGCSLFFSMMGITKELALDEKGLAEISFSSDETKSMPIGMFDASMYLVDKDGRRRTLSNKLAVKVTTNVAEAYDCYATISIKTVGMGEE